MSLEKLSLKEKKPKEYLISEVNTIFLNILLNNAF